jgi:hypothetical protein
MQIECFSGKVVARRFDHALKTKEQTLVAVVDPSDEVIIHVPCTCEFCRNAGSKNRTSPVEERLDVGD